ncbi:MAG TPA: hypothetical protein VFZ78_10080, partial [Flavisolibacter sp.]
TNYQVIGVDATANQQGAAVTGTISVPTTNVGNVQACGISSLQYINYTFDGTSYSITNPATDSLMAFTGALQGTTLLQTLISGFSSGANIAFRFNHPTPAAGTYQMTMLQVNNTMAGNSTTPLTPTVVVTNYPAAVGDYYEGTFSGTYVDNQAVTHVISGNFRLRKNW